MNFFMKYVYKQKHAKTPETSNGETIIVQQFPEKLQVFRFFL